MGDEILSLLPFALIISLSGFISGYMAGLLGVGGGMVFFPVLDYFWAFFSYVKKKHLLLKKMFSDYRLALSDGLEGLVLLPKNQFLVLAKKLLYLLR